MSHWVLRARTYRVLLSLRPSEVASLFRTWSDAAHDQASGSHGSAAWPVSLICSSEGQRDVIAVQSFEGRSLRFTGKGRLSSRPSLPGSCSPPALCSLGCHHITVPCFVWSVVRQFLVSGANPTGLSQLSAVYHPHRWNYSFGTGNWPHIIPYFICIYHYS